MDSPLPQHKSRSESDALTDCLMLELAERLHPNDYRPLGLRLGFTETRLSHIERERMGIITECLYLMLTEWKRREGRSATSQILVQSVRSCHNSEAANWLQAELGLNDPAQRTTSVEDKLHEGNVPALPDCLTDRPVELAEIRGKLRRAVASDKPGRWVVLHGMGGMGKTVLANQAVRDEKLMDECFPDGIYWLSMGNVKEVSSIPDRLETLCRIFDTNLSSAPSPPKTVEQWKHLLTKLISQRYPRSLIVLDDVWMQEVVAAFDVRCTVMITTRDAGVLSRVSGHKDELNLSCGLSEEQSRQALAEWTSIDINDLPSEAALIHGFSRGSPLIIAIVGALLRDFPDRWQFYASQMKTATAKLQTMSTDSSYEYRSAYEAIDMSVEKLSANQMDIYSWFAVFEKGWRVSSKMLTLLAECSKEEVEDRMRDIAQRSLVSTDWSEKKDCRIYWLHDLLHDHLVARKAGERKPASLCNEAKCLMSLCKRFKSCRKDIIQTALHFPPSSAVFQRGLRVAEETKDVFFTKESTDTRPLMFCIRHGTGKAAKVARLTSNGQEVVSADYYGNVQIADLHTGAVRLFMPAHSDIISDISLSPDGSLMATVSSDRSLGVWTMKGDQSTGTGDWLAKRLSYDSARVSCCEFVHYRKELLLLSGDSSGYLKIWGPSFTMRHSLKVHENTVLACSPCHDEGTVATCGKNEAVVKVFSITTGELRTEIEHEDDVEAASQLSNGLIASITWSNLQVFNGSGRRLYAWSTPTDNEALAHLSCCRSTDGHLLATSSRSGAVMVFVMGATFSITRKLSILCRLVVGGVFRQVNSISLSTGREGKGAKESAYLTTVQDAGLLLVWKLVKDSLPPVTDHVLWDVSFSANGSLERLVGAGCGDQRQIQMVDYIESKHSFMNGTSVAKVGDGADIQSLDVEQVPGHVLVVTDRNVQLMKLPKAGKTWSNMKSNGQMFEPAETKVLLAKFIGHQRELLTVSTGAGICIEVWSNEKQPSVICNQEVMSHQALSAALSHDQTSLVIGCTDGTALFFTLCEGRLEEGSTELKGPSSRVSYAEFSTDDSLLLLSGWKHVKVFEVATKREVACAMDDNPISLAAFAMGSTRIVTVSGTFLQLWNTESLAASNYPRATAIVTIKDLKISSDGSYLVTAGHIKTFYTSYIEWWKVESQAVVLLQRFRVNSRIVRVRCNPQFTTFVTVDESGHIYTCNKLLKTH